MRTINVGLGISAFVDDKDFDAVSKYKWKEHRIKINGRFYSSYASTIINGRTVLMHRHILNLTKNDGNVVDHIDRNGLNNTRKNLRVCTQSENQRNRSKNYNNKSGFNGVYFCNSKLRWIVDLKIKGKRIARKSFKDINDAIHFRKTLDTKYNFTITP